MAYNSATLDAMCAAWKAVEGRFAAYRLVLPGSPAFLCQPHACNAYCCRSFTVNLGESEVLRLAASSGKRPRGFLECEDGTPIALPLAQPYILARKKNACALLDASLECSEYAGRPNACRMYPHFVLFYDVAEGRTTHAAGQKLDEAMERLITREAPRDIVPLLVRHTECPGFTGPPIGPDAWLDLLRETYALQYQND